MQSYKNIFSLAFYVNALAALKCISILSNTFSGIKTTILIVMIYMLIAEKNSQCIAKAA